MTRRELLTLLFAQQAFAFGCKAKETHQEEQQSNPEIYALQYGRSSYNAKYVFRDGNNEEIPFAWMFWLVKDGKKNILIDAGIADTEFVARWKISAYIAPRELLGAMGIRPEDISAIILTHLHADHCDGLTDFPDATLYLQRNEYSAIQAALARAPGDASSNGYWRQHLELLQDAEKRGTLRLLEGDAEITPNIRVELEPFHTRGTQSVVVRTAGAKVYLVPDNAYLDANLEGPLAVGTAVDYSGNLEYLERLKELKQSGHVIIPGHEPGIFRRYETSLESRCAQIVP